MRHQIPMSVGAVVGDYVLGKPIGAGGMGVVYDAVPRESSHRRVAIKMPYRESLFDDRAIARFRCEVVAGRIVQHPNVVSVLEDGQTDDGLPYLVMEHVTGERLAERIHRDDPLPLSAALTIMRQVLAGLDGIHSMGIVHGDITTDNILVGIQSDHSDVAKLIDFGLARVSFSPYSEPDEPHLDIISGTPDYMAPEMIVGAHSSYRSDVYAAGIVLYELLTGQTPFEGGASNEILRRHLDDDVVPPSMRMVSSCPPHLDRIVARALEKEPPRRFATANEFERAIALALRSIVNEPARCQRSTRTLRRKALTVDAVEDSVVAR